MGNFSRDTFNRLKHYVGVRLQQGVPIVDADWNELEDIRKYELQAFLKWFVGNGVPAGNDGFRIVAVTDSNDFGIQGGDGTAAGAGHCLVDGWDVMIEQSIHYTAQPLFNNPALAKRWAVEPLLPLTTPQSNRTDLVYLDVWEREVDATEDRDHLVNPAIGIETAVRLKREWVVRVVEGTTTLPTPPTGHSFYALATVQRTGGTASIVTGAITDRRQTGLTLASLETTVAALGTQLARDVVKKAGDTMTGDLTIQKYLNVRGQVRSGELEVIGGARLGYETAMPDFRIPLSSGFYEKYRGSPQASPVNDIPDTSHDWIHLIVARHSNLTNNHQLQIASSFTDNDRLFFRKIARLSLEPQDVAWHELAVLDQVVNKAGDTMTGALNVQNDLAVTGKVGIGIEPRRNGLDVLGEIVATSRLTLAQDASSTTMTWHLDNTDSRLRIFHQPNINTDGTERLIIDQDGNVSLHSTGFSTLTVGAGANGAIKVRHVNGKHGQNDTDDTLHLNWSTGRPVRVGGTGGDGMPSSLLVEGLVGIGTISPQYTLEVNGTAGKPGGGMWTDASDIRLKRNVQTLHDALTKLLQLRGVSYEWQEPDKHGHLTGAQMGLVAQEVEAVFPEWVSTNASGLKDVTIRGLEALVVEALRELDERITALALQQQQAT